jgi:hypothetical protein
LGNRIISAQPEVAVFREYENIAISICREENISLIEFLDSKEFSVEASYYKKARADAAQRKWDIELFTSDLAAGKACPDFMYLKTGEIQKGYNTTPWKERKKRMVDTFVRHPPLERISIDDILSVFSGERQIVHKDEFFVPIDRLRNTCSLRTSLKFQLKEQTEADPLPQEVASSILKRKQRCLQGLPGNEV